MAERDKGDCPERLDRRKVVPLTRGSREVCPEEGVNMPQPCEGVKNPYKKEWDR
ncbi:hypothetical protein PP740_gp048 [Stenotrophomonas phage Philippe]|uniref:Uncharacterized protein n=1 Tax=Stenotrophomonas phage Philippe TaxID=2859655 RepID=A0AAE7WN61_9CAUD|nr:hypothetical protein PP740_gp048 [Stenotrophomonas phage Philippe]QYW02294.1 hypothetical protein CPT_Philippe_101 [Stenotrophomonas phage Philippe]